MRNAFALNIGSPEFEPWLHAEDFILFVNSVIYFIAHYKLFICILVFANKDVYKFVLKMIEL